MAYSDKEQQRAYQRKWIHERREAFLKGKKCVSCGSKENLCVIRGDLSTTVWSKKDYKKLLKGREVLCSKCLLSRKRRPPEHGSANTYRKHKCRCAPCIAAYHAYQKERRFERKLPKKERDKRKLKRRLFKIIKRKGYSHLFGGI